MFPAGEIVEAEMAQPIPLDEAEFNSFYLRTAPKLRSYLARITGDVLLADDLLQEAFCRFLQASLPAMDEAKKRSYLYRTATNLACDHWRLRGREAGLEREPEAAAVEPDHDVARVFSRLGPRQRALLWLAYVEGCDHREIAGRLGLTHLTVRVSLYRARRKLARMLEREGLR
ncbi:MAG: RNA polymerase sigma factor [Bryobacteraceae bacterium]